MLCSVRACVYYKDPNVVDSGNQSIWDLESVTRSVFTRPTRVYFYIPKSTAVLPGHTAVCAYADTGAPANKPPRRGPVENIVYREILRKNTFSTARPSVVGTYGGHNTHIILFRRPTNGFHFRTSPRGVRRPISHCRR